MVTDPKHRATGVRAVSGPIPPTGTELETWHLLQNEHGFLLAARYDGDRLCPWMVKPLNKAAAWHNLPDWTYIGPAAGRSTASLFAGSASRRQGTKGTGMIAPGCSRCNGTGEIVIWGNTVVSWPCPDCNTPERSGTARLGETTMPYADIERQRDWQRSRYQRVAVTERARSRSSKASNAKIIKEWIALYLQGHPCIDCGEADLVVLEFDHRDPASKLRRLAEMRSGKWKFATVVAEVAKCDVRCANCHRRRTYLQQRLKSAATAAPSTNRNGTTVGPQAAAHHASEIM